MVAFWLGGLQVAEWRTSTAKPVHQYGAVTLQAPSLRCGRTEMLLGSGGMHNSFSSHRRIHQFRFSWSMEPVVRPLKSQCQRGRYPLRRLQVIAAPSGCKAFPPTHLLVML